MHRKESIPGQKFVKNLFILALASLYATSSFSQEAHNAISITGHLVDSSSNEPVSDASVQITNVKDTVQQYFSRSSGNGFFEANKLDTGSYIIKVTHQGYEDLKKFLMITSHDSIVDLGRLKLQQAYKILAEVTVKDRIPMKVNGDTIAYKADAYKTKEHASVEDLLKKLPGVQVDRNGMVKAQGEQVQKVYVDGKDFFSNNPKLATRNLTADMIDQVQVFNDASEQSKFSGIDDGSRTKTINLKLKKDKKSGIIGKAYAGYGTDKRYSTGVALNYFKGASKISLIAGANNINNPGIIQNGSANGNSFNSSGIGLGTNGFVNASSLGLNYQDILGKNINVSGSYLFDNSNLSNTTNTVRQTFLVDSTLRTDGGSVYTNSKKSHQLNLHLIYNVDSFNSIVFTTNTLIQKLQQDNSNSLINYMNKKDIAFKASEDKNTNQSDGISNNQVNNLIWRRSFKRPGQTVSVNVSNVVNNNDWNTHNVSSSNFYSKEGLLSHQRNTDFKVDNMNNSSSHGLAISYTEPLSINKILEFNFNYNKNKNSSDRKTYTYNQITKSYDNLIDSLTSNFNNTNDYKRYGTNLKAWSSKYNYQIGIAMQQAVLERDDPGKSIHLAQRYFNFLPNASLNYRITKNKSFQISYRGQTNLPSIVQLQNSTDLTRYPYIIKGNPELRQEFVNNVMLTYNAFNSSTLHNLFVNIAYSNTHNKISNTIQTNGVEQLYMPVNLNGVYYVSSSINYGIPIKRMEGGTIDFTTNMDYYHNASLLNGSKNYMKDLSIGEELSLSYTYNESLEIQVNAGVSYNSARYSVQRDQNTSYFTHDYALDVVYSFPKDITLYTNIDYQIYTGNANGLNKNIFMWNASLSKQLFKNRRGEIKISVNDILNKNQNIRRNVADNFFETVHYTTLKRYVLLTFTYNINQSIATNRKESR